MGVDAKDCELHDLQVTQNLEVLPSLTEEWDEPVGWNGSDEETFDNTKQSHVLRNSQQRLPFFLLAIKQGSKKKKMHELLA